MLIYKLSAVFTFALLVFSCKDRNESPCILQATHDAGSSKCGFIFRKDKTYEWLNGSGLGVYSIVGTYNLNDSIITLDKANIDNVVVSKYLHIRSHEAVRGLYTTYGSVLQANADKKILENAISFIIYIDKINN